jgi:hypothetical protein
MDLLSPAWEKRPEGVAQASRLWEWPIGGTPVPLALPMLDSVGGGAADQLFIPSLYNQEVRVGKAMTAVPW